MEMLRTWVDNRLQSMYCPCDVRSLCTREARIETAAYRPVDMSVIAIPTLQGSPSCKYLLGVENIDVPRVVLKIRRIPIFNMF